MKFSLHKLYCFSLGIALFFQVLLPKQAPIGIILIAVSIILLALKKELQLFKTKVHLFFVLFYVAYLVGIFFTRDGKEAAHVLESKLSFVIFPLFFLVVLKQKVDLKIPIIFYIIALIFQFSIGLYNSSLCYAENSSFSCFLSSSFSPIHHPTYMAIYYLVGILLVSQLKPISAFLKYGLIGIFALGYLLCMSLSAILFLALLIAVVGFIWFRKKFGTLKSIGLVSLLLVGLVVVIDQSKDTVSDIEYTYNSLKNYVHSPTEYVKKANRYLVGNEERLVLWTVATQAIIENPLGYGTGNIDIVLGNKLNSYGLHDLAEKKFNPHNQYLQTWIETGIFGVFILIGLFIVIIQIAWKNKNWTLLILTASFVFNSLFESMFQRQSGIMFFTLVTFILLLSSQKKPKKEDYT